MRGKKPRARSYQKPNRWQSSAEWKRIGSAAIRAYNATRHRLPKCGAKTRTTGEPCKHPALENGRCRLHGGLTPKGADWGVRQFTPKPPAKQTKKDWPRAQAKIDRFDREDKVRKRQLALMTSDEFRSYFLRTHARHGREFRRVVDAEMRRRGLIRSEILPGPNAPTVIGTPAPVNAELERLEAEIERLKKLQAAIQRRDNEPDKGVFG